MKKTKTCNKCEQEKPIDEFYKDKTKNDGRCSWCKQCRRKYREKHREYYLAYNKQYRKKNPQKCIDSSKKWREEHIDRILEANRKYYQDHKEQVLERLREYYKEHKSYILKRSNKYDKSYSKTEKGKASKSRNQFKRRSRLRDCLNDFTAEQWKQIKKSQNYTCQHCGLQEPEIKLEVDHIIPVSKGGHHTASNIQGLCKSCNCKKGNRTDLIIQDMVFRFYSHLLNEK